MSLGLSHHFCLLVVHCHSHVPLALSLDLSLTLDLSLDLLSLCSLLFLFFTYQQQWTTFFLVSSRPTRPPPILSSAATSTSTATRCRLARPASSAPLVCHRCRLSLVFVFFISLLVVCCNTRLHGVEFQPFSLSLFLSLFLSLSLSPSLSPSLSLFLAHLHFLGPVSRSVDMLRSLIDAGLCVVRLNFSHGDHEVWCFASLANLDHTHTHAQTQAHASKQTQAHTTHTHTHTHSRTHSRVFFCCVSLVTSVPCRYHCQCARGCIREEQAHCHCPRHKGA